MLQIPMLKNWFFQDKNVIFNPKELIDFKNLHSWSPPWEEIIESPQSNGICKRFHRTIQDEFYAVAFRKKLYESIERSKQIWINGSKNMMSREHILGILLWTNAMGNFWIFKPLKKGSIKIISALHEHTDSFLPNRPPTPGTEKEVKVALHVWWHLCGHPPLTSFERWLPLPV